MKDDYFCPMSNAWNNIFNDLIEGYEESTGKKLPKGVQAIREAGGPPTPLVLGAWLDTGYLQKAARWQETIKWAEEHHLSHLIIVKEEDMYRGE